MDLRKQTGGAYVIDVGRDDDILGGGPYNKPVFLNNGTFGNQV